jgi:hypothetical protein
MMKAVDGRPRSPSVVSGDSTEMSSAAPAAAGRVHRQLRRGRWSGLNRRPLSYGSCVARGAEWLTDESMGQTPERGALIATAAQEYRAARRR